jgi:hypothetical protein
MEHTIFGLIKRRGDIARQHMVVVKAADLDLVNVVLAHGFITFKTDNKN